MQRLGRALRPHPRPGGVRRLPQLDVDHQRAGLAVRRAERRHRRPAELRRAGPAGEDPLRHPVADRRHRGRTWSSPTGPPSWRPTPRRSSSRCRPAAAPPTPSRPRSWRPAPASTRRSATSTSATSTASTAPPGSAPCSPTSSGSSTRTPTRSSSSSPATTSPQADTERVFREAGLFDRIYPYDLSHAATHARADDRRRPEHRAAVGVHRSAPGLEHPRLRDLPGHAVHLHPARPAARRGRARLHRRAPPTTPAW